MAKGGLFVATLAALLLPASALAQLGGVGLPTLPVPDIGGATQDLPGIPDASLPTPPTVRDLLDLRRVQIRNLLRQHGSVLEVDPQGEPIVRGEILAMASDAAALAPARARGFTITQTDTLDGVGAMTTLHAPRGMATSAALAMLRSLDPEGIYDFDHLHEPSGPAPTHLVLELAPSGEVGRLRIGLIDGGVGAHPSLAGAIAEQRAFASAAPAPSAHATAIASLLAGRGEVQGAAPGASLYVADVYGGAPTGGSAAALARALSWLANESIPVINVSLVGPRNRIVENMIESLVRRGFVVVAAVGNDGPAAPPLYPAAYPGVVGVTGVDVRERALVEAERGPQVDFAAPGMPMAAVGRGAARLRGTSYAAPIVAGLLAHELTAPSAEQAAHALNALRAEAQDLGARGRDDVYGDGLVGTPFLTARAH